MGWAVVAATGGGIDPGDGLPGAGITGAFLALALGAPLAAGVAMAAWGTAALRARATQVAVGAAAGLAAWSALSMLWAAGPDLAWIDANRAAIALCALVVGAGLGALLPRAPRDFGLGLAAAALIPVGLAVGTKVFPAVAGTDRDLARLSEPVGYWNAVALVAVMALPGLLWLAAGPAQELRRWGPAVAGAGVALVVCALLLTYSRGGLAAAVIAVAITLALLPGTWRGLAAVLGGIAGAALPSHHALTTPALTTDMLAPQLRESAGLGLGWRLLVGMAIGALLAAALPRIADRAGIDTPRVRRAVAVGCAALVGLGAVAFVAAPDGRDWISDRWAEVRDDDHGAVANDPGRVINASGNQRSAWWRQAWHGFAESPVVGQGAGGFRLVHLQQRTQPRDRLITTETHDTLLRTLSGLGLVGLGLLVALAAAVGLALCRALARERRAAEIAMPVAVLAAFAAQAMIDWSWAIPALTIPALAAAGIVLAAAAPEPAGASRRRSRPGPLAAAGLACAVVVAIISALMPWWSVQLTDSAERELADGRPEIAVQRADAAAARNPLSLAPLRTKVAALTAQGDAARTLGVLLEMTRLQPDNPASWRMLARFYGDDPRAVPAWERVRELSPMDRDATAALG